MNLKSVAKSVRTLRGNAKPNKRIDVALIQSLAKCSRKEAEAAYRSVNRKKKMKE